MILLHAGYCKGVLLLWGEIPSPGGKLVARRRAGKEARRGSTARATSSLRTGRPAPTAPALPHPFAAAALSLRAALRRAGFPLPAAGKSLHPVLAWLPSFRGRPLPSSPLIAAPPAGAGRARIAAWKVPAVPLALGEAADLLLSCQGKQVLAPGLIIGNDLSYWAQAFHFAASLVVRQSFLPGVAKDNREHYACWLPVFSGEDGQRRDELIRSMPPCGRALSQSKTASAAAPAGRPASMLKAFLDTVVDRLVRSRHDRPPPPLGTLKESPPPSACASLHDQWLKALTRPDGRLQGEAEELERFAGQVREWLRPITVATQAVYRLCFRLEEPEEEEETQAGERGGAPASTGKGRADGAPATPAAPHGPATPAPPPSPWRLSYLLQPLEDRSLLIPVRIAWTMKGPKAAAFKRFGAEPREYLLSALGQAAGLWPPIEASLKAPAPEGCDLDTGQAYEFLSRAAPALKQAGFGVLLPAWWTGKGGRLRLSARAGVRGPALPAAGMSLETVLSFNWEIALGKESLSRQELEALAALKQPLVRLRGRWVEMDAGSLQAALKLYHGAGSGRAKLRDIVRMALGAGDAKEDLELQGVEAEGWIADLLKRLQGEAAFTELDQPKGFSGRLRAYQKRGFSWLAFLRRWGLGACLADDMGLGKTVQALALIQKDWEEGGRGPVLLVCPTSVVGNWQREAARFTPRLPVQVHHGLQRSKGEAFKQEASRQALVISTYTLLHRDQELLREVEWAGVVLDEAQNIKNPETRQARAARGLKAGYRAALTGTPVENSVSDLWSIMEFLNPGLLGSRAAFKESFLLPIHAGGDAAACRRLQRLTAPFVLRRLKSDRAVIADLPKKMEMKVFCSLTPEQASLYRSVLKETEEVLASSEGIQRKGMILAAFTRLKQICNHPAQFLGDNSSIPGRSGKLSRLLEMLEEVAAVRERALVFTQFVAMGAILKGQIEESFGREAPFLHGGVPRRERERMVERFQAENDGPLVFILSLKAGGTGLNLTGASHVFHFDRWWNPAVENQATDRVYRIGQKKKVQVHKLVSAGTLEEKIDELIEKKKGIAERVIGSGEAWLTELSNAELRELIALRPAGA